MVLEFVCHELTVGNLTPPDHPEKGNQIKEGKCLTASDLEFMHNLFKLLV